MAAVTSDHLVVLTTHEGDADDREENRDPKNQCTIHPQILHKNKTGTYRTGIKSCRLLGPAHRVTADTGASFIQPNCDVLAC
jgi:hypothetical protein